MRCVLDTNVVVAGMRGPRGVSAALLMAARRSEMTSATTTVTWNLSTERWRSRNARRSCCRGGSGEAAKAANPAAPGVLRASE